jgi:hypothetical protein
VAHETDRSESDRCFAFPPPLMEWGVVLSALDPTRQPTRGWGRQLREQGRLSDGVKVARRGTHGLQGSGTYNSVLWVWADRCRSAGHEVDAAHLQDTARDLERRFEPLLKPFLAVHDLAQLPDAPFFDDLTRLTADALTRHASCLQDVVLASGLLRLDVDHLSVLGHRPDGQAAVVDLPAHFPGLDELRAGMCVWVTSTWLGRGVYVGVEETVPVALPPDLAEQLLWTRVPSLPDSTHGLALTDLTKVRVQTTSDEAADVLAEADAAAHYEATVAGRPDPEYWDELFDRAREGRVAFRHLRPVG